MPGGQAQYLRVPEAQFGPVKVPAGPPDEQYLYLSDILPTAYQAVAYADIPAGGTLAVLGLGPVGQKATGLLPDPVAAKLTDRAAIDRLDVLHSAVKAVRRGGTVSVSGVYGGEADPNADDGNVRPGRAVADGSVARATLD